MSKSKADKLLSQFIREIAREPLNDGEKETQAEALARKIWKMAQGYDETLDSGRIKKYAPDKAMIIVIMERLEGRVPTVDVKDKGRKATVADRVKEQSRNRLNALAKKD